jgi:acetyl-CoA carboxylase carboxyltransferase component
MFRNNAKMSAMGIPQIAAVMGSCVAGGAYLPIMSDEALIVEGTGSIFLAGSFLVRAAIGEDIDNETLGGADTHSGISGVTDYKCKNDEDALHTIRKLIGHQSIEVNPARLSREKSNAPDGPSICSVLPGARNQPYATHELIASLVDANSFTEYKKEYGKTIITGYARIDGWSVGIVANQRKLVKSKTDGMQFGGVIYSDSADKSARFIMNCNQKGIPLVFFCKMSRASWWVHAANTAASSKMEQKWSTQLQIQPYRSSPSLLETVTAQAITPCAAKLMTLD